MWLGKLPPQLLCAAWRCSPDVLGRCCPTRTCSSISLLKAELLLPPGEHLSSGTSRRLHGTLRWQLPVCWEQSLGPGFCLWGWCATDPPPLGHILQVLPQDQLPEMLRTMWPGGAGADICPPTASEQGRGDFAAGCPLLTAAGCAPWSQGVKSDQLL